MAGTHLDYSKPHLMSAFTDEWPCRSWTFKTLADLLGNQTFSCRVAEKSCDQKMETQCSYHDVTIKEFCDWLDGAPRDRNPLRFVPREDNCCYIDYKYMMDMFKEHPHIFDEVRWEDFGLVGYNGYDSTIWISSEGANTPAHQDTYGFNLVTQIYGRKLWILFPPEDSAYLYPTRVPYEESSIFTEVNVRRPDLQCHPQFKRSHPYVVTLQPGQTLYVPRHWWHYVESLEPSVSINVWVPMKEDIESHFSEAITRCLATGLISSLDTSNDGCQRSRWLNTTESLAPTVLSLMFLKASLSQLLEDSHCLVAEEKQDGSGDAVYRHELLQNKDFSHGIILGDFSQGLNQGDCSQELKQSDTSLGIIEGDLSHVIIEGDLSRGLNQGDCSQELNQGDCSQELKQGDLSHETAPGNILHKTTQGDISHETTQGDILHETTQDDTSHEIVNQGSFQHRLIQQGGFQSEKEAKTAADSEPHSQCSKGDTGDRICPNVRDSPTDELNVLNSQTLADHSEGATDKPMLCVFIEKMKGYKICSADSPFQCDIDICLPLTAAFDSQASSPKKATTFDSQASSPKKATAFDSQASSPKKATTFDSQASSPKKATAFDSQASSPKKAKLDPAAAEAPSNSEKNLTEASSSRIISIKPCSFDTYLRFLFSLCRQIQCKCCFLEPGATDCITISNADRNNVSGNADRNTFSSNADRNNVSGSGNRNNVSGNADRNNVSGNADKNNVSGNADRNNVSGSGNRNNVSGSGDRNNVSGSGDRNNVSGSGDRNNVSGNADRNTFSSNADRNTFSSNADRNNVSTHTKATGSNVSQYKTRTTSNAWFDTADGGSISCLKGEFSRVCDSQKRKTSFDCKDKQYEEASGDASAAEKNCERDEDSESVDSGSLAAEDYNEFSRSEVAEILLSCTLHPRVVELISQLFREQCQRRLNQFI